MAATLQASYDSLNASHTVCEVQAAVLQRIERRMNNIPNQRGEVHNARTLLLEYTTAFQVYIAKVTEFQEKAARFNTLKAEFDTILLGMERAADV